MSDSRTQLNIKIDAKHHWIAGLMARHWGMTLAEFVESCIVKGSSRPALIGDEPKVTEPNGPSATSQLAYEELWSDDEATRFYNLVMSPEDLLTDAQRKTWASISRQAAKDGRKLTLKTFSDYYNASSEAK